jgi:hypothetical protein
VVQIAILITIVSVLANAQCFGKCLGGSCSDDAQTNSSCHHQQTQHRCPYQQLLADNGVRAVKATHVHDTRAEFLPRADNLAAGSAPVALLNELPAPPLLPPIFSPILRI